MSPAADVRGGHSVQRAQARGKHEVCARAGPAAAQTPPGAAHERLHQQRALPQGQDGCHLRRAARLQQVSPQGPWRTEAGLPSLSYVIWCFTVITVEKIREQGEQERSDIFFFMFNF